MLRHCEGVAYPKMSQNVALMTPLDLHVISLISCALIMHLIIASSNFI